MPRALVVEAEDLEYVLARDQHRREHIRNSYEQRIHVSPLPAAASGTKERLLPGHNDYMTVRTSSWR